MLPTNRNRPQPRPARSWYFSEMDLSDPKRKPRYLSKIIMAALLTAMCVVMLTQPSCHKRPPSVFSIHDPGVTHVLVTGGAGYIGSHAALRLLKDSFRVTIVDNLSRGNIGAIKVLQNLFPEPGRLQFIQADLGDPKAVNRIFAENAFDAVMHFAAVAYVGESLCYRDTRVQLFFAASTRIAASTRVGRGATRVGCVWPCRRQGRGGGGAYLQHVVAARRTGAHPLSPAAAQIRAAAERRRRQRGRRGGGGPSGGEEAAAPGEERRQRRRGRRGGGGGVEERSREEEEAAAY